MCAGLGDTVCQFEGYTGEQAGYLYFENGFHPEAQRRLLAGIADQSAVALDNLRPARRAPRAGDPRCLDWFDNFRPRARARGSGDRAGGALRKARHLL